MSVCCVMVHGVLGLVEREEVSDGLDVGTGHWPVGVAVPLLGAMVLDSLVAQAGARVGVVQKVLLGSGLSESGAAVLEVVEHAPDGK